jgi:hypothetical protein
MFKVSSMIGLLAIFQAISLVLASSYNQSDQCYFIPLPSIPPSTDHRTIPWGKPTIQYANGTTCCSSLDEIRYQLDTIDAQLLQILATRYDFFTYTSYHSPSTEVSFALSEPHTSGKQLASKPQLQMSTFRLEMSR